MEDLTHSLIESNPPSSPTTSAILAQPRNKARTRRDIRLIGLSIILLLIVACGIFVYLFLRNRNNNVLQSSRSSASELLKQQAATSEPRTVTSSLGMSLTYDNKTIMADGQTTDATSTTNSITGMSYDNDELLVNRDYSMFRFYIRDTDGVVGDSFGITKPSLWVATNIRKDYWGDKINLPEYSGKDKTLILAESQVKKIAVDGKTASKPEDIILGDTAYKKVVYSLTYGEGDLATTKVDTAYYTVQNDRPYFLTIYGTSTNTGMVTQLEAVISTLKFSAPDLTKLGLLQQDVDQKIYTASNIIVASTASAINVPSEDANIPSTLDTATIVDVILRNQPAVVRIGAARCATVTLSDPTSETSIKFDNACNGGIGSGSFITSDGYVATNGHVVSISKKSLISGYLLLSKTEDELKSRLTTLLNFLKSSGKMSGSDIPIYLAELRSGNINTETFLDKVAEALDIYATLENDTTQYIIQTSNDPLRIDSTSAELKFNYTTTNIPATFVAKNFDDSLSLNDLYIDKLTSTDVALLKAVGTFPITKVASLDSLIAGDQLTAMGYPAFVDDGLNTTQSKTVPSITQGKIKFIQNDPTDTYKLAFTTVPISSGNSGGPSFNDKGEQVGLNTYASFVNCDPGKCFGNGTVRDMKDLSNLASKNSVRLTGESEVNNQWNKALDAYLVGNFKGAEKEFKKVSEQYPANYLASSFISLAASKIGSTDDRSNQFGVSPALMYALIGIVVLIVSLVIAALIIVRKHHRQHGSRRKPLAESLVTAPSIDGAMHSSGINQGAPVAFSQQPSTSFQQQTLMIDKIPPMHQADQGQASSYQAILPVDTYPQENHLPSEPVQASQIQHQPDAIVQPTVQATNELPPIEQVNTAIPVIPSYQQLETNTVKTIQVETNQQKVFAQPLPNNIEFVQPNTAPGIITGGPQGQVMDILPQSRPNGQ